MAQESVACPICEANRPEAFLHVRDIKLFVPGEFDLVRCQNCGLVYMNPRPGPDDMGAYYPAQYWAPPPPKDAPPYLDTGMRRALELLARDYPGGRVLDVGCGVGRIPALMRDRGLDAVGLEPYGHARDLALERYGDLEIVCEVLQEAALPEASFDAVTFFDVLEHVHDPIGDLRKAHSLLKPGGAVLIKVPNIASLQAKPFGAWWYGLDTPRHLFHFSPRSLRRALEAAGFTDISVSAVPDKVGALLFEISVVYWLRGRLLARKGVEVQPTEGQTVGEALEGQVYATVPSAGKRAFRWLVRNVLYAPVAIENAIGRSVELLAVARK